MEDCAICLDTVHERKTLKCSHSFCSACIDSVFKLKPACPICNTYYGEYTGTQPEGSMTDMRSYLRLPGFERCGSIVIQYTFPAGIQGVRPWVRLTLSYKLPEEATYQHNRALVCLTSSAVSDFTCPLDGAVVCY